MKNERLRAKGTKFSAFGDETFRCLLLRFVCFTCSTESKFDSICSLVFDFLSLPSFTSKSDFVCSATAETVKITGMAYVLSQYLNGFARYHSTAISRDTLLWRIIYDPNFSFFADFEECAKASIRRAHPNGTTQIPRQQSRRRHLRRCKAWNEPLEKSARDTTSPRRTTQTARRRPTDPPTGLTSRTEKTAAHRRSGHSPSTR